MHLRTQQQANSLLVFQLVVAAVYKQNILSRLKIVQYIIMKIVSQLKSYSKIW